MRLTLIQMATKRRFPTFPYRGKHRIVKPVTLPALINRRFEIEREEKVMLLLRHPYLTTAQSHGHMSKFRDPDHHAKTTNDRRVEKFTKTFTWAEQLSHLRTKDAWD